MLKVADVAVTVMAPGCGAGSHGGGCLPSGTGGRRGRAQRGDTGGDLEAHLRAGTPVAARIDHLDDERQAKGSVDFGASADRRRLFEWPTDGILTVRLKVAEALPAVAVTCAAPPMVPRVANAEASPSLSVVRDHVAERDRAGGNHLPGDRRRPARVTSRIRSMDHQGVRQVWPGPPV